MTSQHEGCTLFAHHPGSWGPDPMPRGGSKVWCSGCLLESMRCCSKQMAKHGKSNVKPSQIKNVTPRKWRVAFGWTQGSSSKNFHFVCHEISTPFGLGDEERHSLDGTWHSPTEFWKSIGATLAPFCGAPIVGCTNGTDPKSRPGRKCDAALRNGRRRRVWYESWGIGVSVNMCYPKFDAWFSLNHWIICCPYPKPGTIGYIYIYYIYMKMNTKIKTHTGYEDKNIYI